MLVLSLFAFFIAVSLLGVDGFGVIAQQNQGRLIVFFFLLILSLVFSWRAFINSLRQFQYYHDRRWAWFCCIFTDLTATLMTVADLYSIISSWQLWPSNPDDRDHRQIGPEI
jgi:hypothetical protein